MNVLYSETLHYEGETHKDKIVNLLQRIKVEDYQLKNTPVKDKLFYCILPTQINPSVAINDYNLINDELYNYYKSGYRIKFVFINIVECDLEDALDIIYKKIKTLGINEDDIIIISENQKVNKLNKYDFKVYPIRFTPIGISLTMKDISPITDMPFIEDKKYLFQCYNNLSKSHRYGILTLLKHYDILSLTDWSLMNPQQYYPIKGNIPPKYIFSKETLESLFESYEFILNKGNTKYSEYEDDSMRNPNANGEPDHNITYRENPHKNAYINVVTESQFLKSDIIHITEKTIIPFYFLQLPIIVSTPHFIKSIRENYDFDLFDDFIDHSYDLETNHEKRIFMIANELKRISENKESLIKFYKDNKDRFLKNQQLVIDLVNDNHILDIFKQFV